MRSKTGGELDDEGERTTYSDELSGLHGSVSLQSTLSELDQQTGAMLSLMQEPKALKMVEDVRRLRQSLLEQCSQLCIQSSLSSASESMHENFDDMDKEVKSASPDSKPESVVEDPDIDFDTKSNHHIGSYEELTNGFSYVEVGELIHKSGSASIHEMSNDSETKDTPEQKFACSEEMLKLLEDNDWYIKELTRRNEERRVINKELLFQIKKLVKEIDALLQKQNKLMDENGVLRVEIQKLIRQNSAATNCPRCFQVTENESSLFSRLKSYFLGW